MLEVSQKKRWKLLLLAGSVFISLFFLWFTNYLVQELMPKEIGELKRVASAYEQADDPTIEDYSEILEVIRNTTIPLIVVDGDDHIILTKNYSPEQAKDSTYLKEQLSYIRIINFYNEPVEVNYAGGQQYIYYDEQRAITLLRYFPYVQLMLIALFLTISYVAFTTSHKYEQNKVWVGLAKETAHQIGTPLSSLIAWVEYLKVMNQPPTEEIIIELEKDIELLNIITERFSKIGSAPELERFNIYDVIDETIEYLKRRISNKVKVSISKESEKEAYAAINKNLFSWVIENLVKNAVDAMAGEGIILFRITKTKKEIIIDVRDTGKGIPKSNYNLVFEPGYTTRRRGWGLGLSLAKRIITNYHNGEIGVKDSEIGKGTTFRIKLNRIAG